jgi:hypothetical protein
MQSVGKVASDRHVTARFQTHILAAECIKIFEEFVDRALFGQWVKIDFSRLRSSS